MGFCASLTVETSHTDRRQVMNDVYQKLTTNDQLTVDQVKSIKPSSVLVQGPSGVYPVFVGDLESVSSQVQQKASQAVINTCKEIQRNNARQRSNGMIDVDAIELMTKWLHHQEMLDDLMPNFIIIPYTEKGVIITTGYLGTASDAEMFQASLIKANTSAIIITMLERSIVGDETERRGILPSTRLCIKSDCGQIDPETIPDLSKFENDLAIVQSERCKPRRV